MNKGIILIASALAIGTAVMAASKVQNISSKIKASVGTPEKISLKGTSIGLNLPVTINNQSAVNVKLQNMYVTVQNKDNSGNWEDLFVQPNAVKEVPIASYKTSKLPVIPLQLTSLVTLGKVLAGKLPQTLKCIIRFDVAKFELPPIEFEIDATAYFAPIRAFMAKNPLLSKLKLGYANVSFHHRAIKPGYEYDRLFPKPQYIEPTLSSIVHPLNTIELMGKIILETLYQTKAIAKVLTGSTREQSIKNTWKFLHEHIQYKNDPEDREQLKTPSASWELRKEGIDCDCFAIFASSIFLNMGINNAIKMVSVEDNMQFGHVYLVAPKDNNSLVSVTDTPDKYYVVDPCLHNFNQEPKKITNKYIKNMRTTMLAGIGNAELGKISLKKIVQTPKKLVQAVVKTPQKLVQAVVKTPPKLVQRLAPKSPFAKPKPKPQNNTVVTPVRVVPAVGVQKEKFDAKKTANYFHSITPKGYTVSEIEKIVSGWNPIYVGNKLDEKQMVARWNAYPAKSAPPKRPANASAIAPAVMRPTTPAPVVVTPVVVRPTTPAPVVVAPAVIRPTAPAAPVVVAPATPVMRQNATYFTHHKKNKRGKNSRKREITFNEIYAATTAGRNPVTVNNITFAGI